MESTDRARSPRLTSPTVLPSSRVPSFPAATVVERRRPLRRPLRRRQRAPTHQVRTSLPLPQCRTDHLKPSVSYFRPDLTPVTRLCSSHAGSRSCYDGSYPSTMVRSAPLPRDAMICALAFCAGPLMRLPVDGGHDLALHRISFEI